jgi:flagellar assembly protein FliH
LSDMTQIFTFGDLSEESIEVRAQFTSSYEPKGYEPEVRPVDPEGAERKAFEDAYIQGEKAGYEMGMRKAEPLLRSLNHGLSQMAAFRVELVERSERLATELALLFAEAVVLQECSQRKEAVADMVKRALEVCEEKTDLIVRVPRANVDFFGEDVPYTLLADDTLKEPGFIIETNFGDIDGRISTQLEELRKEFLNGSPI